MTQFDIDTFYEELFNDPDFIAYEEQKRIEWMDYMDKEYERLQNEKNPQEGGFNMTTNLIDLE
jgi:hypothetical protein